MESSRPLVVDDPGLLPTERAAEQLARAVLLRRGFTMLAGCLSDCTSGAVRDEMAALLVKKGLWSRRMHLVVIYSLSWPWAGGLLPRGSDGDEVEQCERERGVGVVGNVFVRLHAQENRCVVSVCAIALAPFGSPAVVYLLHTAVEGLFLHFVLLSCTSDLCVWPVTTCWISVGVRTYQIQHWICIGFYLRCEYDCNHISNTNYNEHNV